MARLHPAWVALALVLLLAPPGPAWNNGQSGNANADTAAECSNPQRWADKSSA